MGREVEDPNELVTQRTRSRRRIGQGGDREETSPQENAITGEQESVKTISDKNGITTQPENRKTGKTQSGRTIISDSGETLTRQSEGTGERKNGKTEEQRNEKEMLDQKVTLYLSWRQLDKLDGMVSGYKHRLRKRTDQNKLMRMMIDKFDLDDLLNETK